MDEQKKKTLDIETIFGQIIPKSNNYVTVSNKPNGKRRLIKSDETRAYEKSFILQCRKYKNRMIHDPFRLYCVVYQRSKRFDLDNSLKTILDCLQYTKSITDDNLCVEIVAKKRVDKKNPRLEFALQPVVEEQSLFDLHEAYK